MKFFLKNSTPENIKSLKEIVNYEKIIKLISRFRNYHILELGIAKKELILNLQDGQNDAMMNLVVTTRERGKDFLFNINNEIFLYYACDNKGGKRNEPICKSILKIIYINLKRNQNLCKKTVAIIDSESQFLCDLEKDYVSVNYKNEMADDKKSKSTGIVIITNNRPDLLFEAWMSCKDQGEVIIVANRKNEETKKSQKILRKLKKIGVQIVYHNKPRSRYKTVHGLESAKRNFGAEIFLQIKNIKYLTFLDDDNIFWPKRVERFEHAGLDLAFCDLMDIIIEIDRAQLAAKRFFSGKLMCNYPPHLDTSAVQMSVDVFKKYKWNEKMEEKGEDTEYWQRLMNHGYKFKHLEFIGGEYRRTTYREKIDEIFNEE